MKKCILIIAILLLFSCKKTYTRNFIVSKSDDNNWTTTAAIECDSVTMIDLSTAELWIDGRKMIIKGRIIKIYSN